MAVAKCTKSTSFTKVSGQRYGIAGGATRRADRHTGRMLQ